ncbi:5-(carboxyamino)imidazole ribonucleotide synthase [Corynebacterium sp. sy039]|uniref:5-(carboxyamino)imidazole ribonucleotide synthase n=1 Tax=Corynebacterium sp. sy039 TaxID=2599641 RepID=UPI0021108BD2|nr:5-(carboxyamino)imidazole ribonucleotide synthase [Corynebacterium sp. sy039]
MSQQQQYEQQRSVAAHAPGMPIVSVIGDGQLARMLHTEAIELGLSIRVLAGGLSSSAAQVCSDIVIGDYTDVDTLRHVAKDSAVITFDHEHVPSEHLRILADEGANVQPGYQALLNAQDKLVMRKKLRELGAPVPVFAAIESVADAQAFWEAVSGAVCLKARRGGYDGHGVWFPQTCSELEALVAQLLEKGTPLMAEKKIALTRELSAMVARTPSGEKKTWDVVESVQEDGICTQAIAPAPQLSESLQQQARDLAGRIAEELGVTGVLAVELFETTDQWGQPEIFVNELAMRPHNTGHWSQDGCVTSQFEQHLRAVMDYPLGSTDLRAPVTVMANILGGATEPELSIPERMQAVWRRYPQAKIHLYGKTHRPGRKIGHVNICGTDVEQTRQQALAAAYFMVHGVWNEPENNEPENDQA